LSIVAACFPARLDYWLRPSRLTDHNNPVDINTRILNSGIPNTDNTALEKFPERDFVIQKAF